MAHLVVVAGLERVALQRERLREVGEFLVVEAEHLAQRPRGHRPAHGRVLVREAALHAHHDVAALAHELRDPLQQGVVRDVQRRHDQDLVRGQVGRVREHEIRAHVQVVQRAMDLAYLGAVVGVAAGRTPLGLLRERHVVDGVERVAAPQDCHVVADAQVDEALADLLQFLARAAHFRVRAVGLQVVRQDAFPVRLLVRVDRRPVPVLDHVGAVGQVRVDVLAELPVVRRVLERGAPVGRLRIRFGDEEVAALERTREVAVQLLGRAVVLVLRAPVIDVHAGDVELLRDGGFVDVAVQCAGEIVRDELARARAFTHELRLPVQEVRHAHLAPARPFQLVARALGAVRAGQVRPRMQVLAPVVQEPCAAEVFRRAEFLFQVVLEADEDVVVGGAVAGRLVVDLPADHVRVVLVVRDDAADQALRVEAVGGGIRIHVLAHAVRVLRAVEFRRQDFRMLARHPRGDRIRGRAHDDLDAGLAHCVDDAVHPRRVEAAVLRLPQAPRRFAQAHDVEAGRLDHLDVLVQPLVGHVFVIVRGAVQDGREVGLRGRRGGACAACECACEREREESPCEHSLPFLWVQVWTISHSDVSRQGDAITKFACVRNDLSQVSALGNFVSCAGIFHNCGGASWLPQWLCSLLPPGMVGFMGRPWAVPFFAIVLSGLL